MEHLQAFFEKVLAPQTVREKMHSDHLEALIRLTRSRMHNEVPNEENAPELRDLRLKYNADVRALRLTINDIGTHKYGLAATKLLHDHNVEVGKVLARHSRR